MLTAISRIDKILTMGFVYITGGRRKIQENSWWGNTGCKYSNLIYISTALALASLDSSDNLSLRATSRDT